MVSDLIKLYLENIDNFDIEYKKELFYQICLDELGKCTDYYELITYDYQINSKAIIIYLINLIKIFELEIDIDRFSRLPTINRENETAYYYRCLPSNRTIIFHTILLPFKLYDEIMGKIENPIVK